MSGLWQTWERDEGFDPVFVDDPPGQPDAGLGVRKLAAYVPVSCCLLTDSTGVNHCQHEPYVVPRAPWPRRLRYRIHGGWWDLRERLARRVAGHRWPEDDEA